LTHGLPAVAGTIVASMPEGGMRVGVAFATAQSPASTGFLTRK
jgi:hypothetical protein